MWIRLRQIALVARQLRPVIDDFTAVLGLEPCYVDPGVGVFGLENTLLPVGNQFLEVVAPIKEGTAGGRYLERRGGDGGYMVITQTDEHAARRARALELGVRIAFQFETHGEYRCMQLHPRDTGATFFEIDEQLGDRALEPDGPWHPAGPNWQRAKHTGVAQGIAAAELQVDDPDAVARRWGEITDIAVVADDTGRPTLTLDNATLRFVPVTDGRGEGLGGIDVLVTSADDVRSRAAARGCLAADAATVMIGGLRINPVGTAG
jgi:Glyoxalase-like domain